MTKRAAIADRCRLQAIAEVACEFIADYVAPSNDYSIAARSIYPTAPSTNQAAIVDNKRLGPILAYIAEQQKKLDMSRSAKAPRRRGQKNHYVQGRIDGHPGVALRDLEASRAALSIQRNQPSKGKDG